MTEGWDWLARLAVEPEWLLALAIGLLVVAAGWVFLVLRGYSRLRQQREFSTPQRIAGSLLAAVLCAVVVVPLGVVARASWLQRDLVLDVFPSPTYEPSPSSEASTTAPATAAPTRTTAPRRDPWAGQRRANILLLGSDAAPGRPGVRTDSVVLASIDLRSGGAVLLALPRNLYRARFPSGTRAAARFPSGYPGLLNEIYKYGVEHPSLVPGARRPGVALVSHAVSGTLGLPVDHYFLADMRGFERLIDALGGVRIRVTRPLPIGGVTGVVAPHDWLSAGLRRLDGRDALWYARSRSDSSDYDRMRRQRCLLGALARQADPKRVLLTYDRLVKAATTHFRTDLPRDRLQALVALLPKARRAGVSSVLFVPPVISPSNPNVAYMRATAREAVTSARPPAERSLTSVCSYD